MIEHKRLTLREWLLFGAVCGFGLVAPLLYVSWALSLAVLVVSGVVALASLA